MRFFPAGLGSVKPASGGGPNPGFSPALWLDASDLSTLFQDSAGTVPVTTDGDPVGRWNDKSGNGRNFTQSTSGSRPTYRTSGGFHWLEFDGTSDWLVGATSALSFAIVNLFMAYRPESGTSDFGNIIGVGHAVTHTNPFYRWNALTRTSSGFNYGFHTNGSQTFGTDAGANLGNDLVLAIGYNSMWSNTTNDQRNGIVRINGAVSSNGAAGAGGSLTYPNATPPTIGAQVDGGGDRFKGRIYGVLVGNAAITSQPQIDAWETYLDGLKP